MPIYKYECNKCGHIFEDLRSFSDPDPDECPQCEGEQVRKLISGGNFVLKGSGWYVTDYAGSSSSAPVAADPADAESASSDGDAGSSTESSSKKPAKESSKNASASDAPSGAAKPGSSGSEVA
jgi:putative FmdB family regulatory protein